MKKITTLAASVLAVSALSTSAFANTFTDYREARAGYQALSNQLETMGYQTDEVNLDGANTFGQKESVYLEKTGELQAEYNKLNASH